MKLFRVPMTKAKLAAMPAAERTFLFLVGHACNEITVLQKLIILCMNHPSENEIARQLESGQALVIGRLLMGKLNEAWELIRTRMLENKSVGQKYAALLDAVGQAALAKLKRYFSRSNIINTVRSGYAFHTPADADIERGFSAMPETEPWQFYLSEVRANSFYAAADMVVGFSIAHAIDPGDILAGFEKLLNESVEIAGHMGELLNSCVAAIFVHHFGAEATFELAAELAAPKLSEATLPFFFEPA